jgi:hypothetical protein
LDIKKHHSTVQSGQFFELLNLCHWRVFLYFFAKQHEAMLILQGILFWAFAVVFVGFIIIDQNRFCLRFGLS